MITSTQNKKVKQILKLCDRREREHTGLFFAEGIRIVAEAIQINANIQSIVISPELLTSDFARQLISNIKSSNKNIDIIELDGLLYKRVSSKENPQGIAAVIHQDWSGMESVSGHDRLWVALDEVQNPGNLGSILRTNDAVGGSGVILLDKTTDPYNPASIRGSMGAIFNQKLVRATIDEFARWKITDGWQVIGTSGSADLDYQDIVYPEKLILLMGSERQGLKKFHTNLCDCIVKIPMSGRSDSLNLAAATAVVLYEIYNQFRRKHKI